MKAPRAVAACAVAAAGLSYGYFAYFLRGAPRIIDATTYWLQARALAAGRVTWRPPGPLASFAGRFLLAHDGRLGGIFPQGHPLLLAIGARAGLPWLTGCLTAAALVLVTASLAEALDEGPGVRARSGAIAAVLSATCAALRFHTAETLSHGTAALAASLAFLGAARASSTGSRRALAGAGLALGWCVSIRPVTALAVGAVVAAMLARRATPWRGWAALAAAALPGVAFHVLTQRAVTGRWLVSTQAMYYAASDGPPGCFRYGFGRGVGCLVEHGDFVRAHMPRGYGLLEAAGVTLRRLRAHALDVANCEPLVLALLGARGATLAPWAFAAVAAQVAAYAPFYFDGNVPGGGARMFADVLPIEHALLAVALARRGPRAPAAFLALSLAGFALHGAGTHLALRRLPDHGALAARALPRGLLLVDDDRAFALLHDPADDASAPVVARLRGDDLDAMLRARHPDLPAWSLARGALAPMGEPSRTGALRLRAASLWPPLEQAEGYAAPRGDGALRVVVTGARARVSLALPRATGRWDLRVVAEGAVRAALVRLGGGRELARCDGVEGPCVMRGVSLSGEGVALRVVAEGGGVTLRSVELDPLEL